MTCRFCRLETPARLCQVCQFLAEQVPPEPTICRHCQVPIATPSDSAGLCQLCRGLLQIVRNSQWLTLAQAEWEQENYFLARRKRELLG